MNHDEEDDGRHEMLDEEGYVESSDEEENK